MNIIYLTTSFEKNDYEVFAKEATSLPNPASQNFHRRMIESLRLKNEVEVVSLAPINGANDIHNGNHYHYIGSSKGIFHSVISRSIALFKEAEKLFPDSKPIIIFDPLNLSLARAAKILGKKRGLKRLALLTDNPNNLTRTSNLYSKGVFHYAKDIDGSIALTKSLVLTYHLIEKPYAIILGIATAEGNKDEAPKSRYIYFGGALYERYGITDFLKAFIKAKPDYDLLISGHGPAGQDVMSSSKKNSRIHFLGQVSALQNATLEEGASLLINPRRNNPKIDLESVPSKMFEYLSTASPILSTPNPYFLDEYPNDINWVNNSGEKALELFLLDHLDKNGNLINLIPNHAREKVLANNGKEATAEKCQRLMTDLNSCSN